MSDSFEIESFKNQLISHIIPLYVLHRQSGLSEADSLAKAQEEMRFIVKTCGLQEHGRKRP